MVSRQRTPSGCRQSAARFHPQHDGASLRRRGVRLQRKQYSDPHLERRRRGQTVRVRGLDGYGRLARSNAAQAQRTLRHAGGDRLVVRRRGVAQVVAIGILERRSHVHARRFADVERQIGQFAHRLRALLPRRRIVGRPTRFHLGWSLRRQVSPCRATGPLVDAAFRSRLASMLPPKVLMVPPRSAPTTTRTAPLSDGCTT